MKSIEHLKIGAISVSTLALVLSTPALAQNNTNNKAQATASQEQSAPVDTRTNVRASATDRQGTSADGQREQARASQGQGSPDRSGPSTRKNAWEQAASGEAPTVSDEEWLDRQDASDQQPREEQLGQAVLLDIESFSEELYERGYRQGYVRGLADARRQVMRHMTRLDEQRERSRRAERRQAWRDHAQRQRQAVGGNDGAVVILPPGMSPQAFIRSLQERNEQSRRDDHTGNRQAAAGNQGGERPTATQ